MADMQRLETALRNAHAAGDEQAARRLAQEITAQRQAQQPRTPMQDVGRSAGLITRGAVRGPLGLMGIAGGDLGLKGLAAAEGAIRGREVRPGTMVGLADQAMDAVGLPRPETGLERISSATVEGATGAGGFAGLMRHGASRLEGLGRQVFQRGGAQPGQQVAAGGAGGLGAQTAGELGAGPMTQLAAGVVAGGAMSRPTRGFTDEVEQAIDAARRQGIDLQGAPGDQVRQVARRARDMVPEERGDRMAAVAEGVRGARDTARREVGQMYDTARQTQATVPAAEIGAFRQQAREALADFDTGVMPSVSRRLGELDQILETPGISAAKLDALEGWRRRIASMTPRDGSPEMAASTRLRQEYDRWMTDAFNRGMISGDPQAVGAWRDARQAYRQFAQTFDENRVISDLASKETTPEQMRAWLFNANATGAKRESGLVVRRLNEILGSDSPPMRNLRAEVVADIAEPLLQETPNISQFIRRFDQFIVKNPTLRKELFPDGLGEFGGLAAWARTVAKRPGATITQDQSATLGERLVRNLSRYAFGHGIARGGVRVQTASGVADTARRWIASPYARREILRDYLGLNSASDLMIPSGVGGEIGAMVVANNEED